jgi:hypothetical protein
MDDIINNLITYLEKYGKKNIVMYDRNTIQSKYLSLLLDKLSEKHTVGIVKSKDLYQSEKEDYITVSSIDKTTGKYERSFKKHVDDMCDLHPIIDVYLSDIYMYMDERIPEVVLIKDFLIINHENLIVDEKPPSSSIAWRYLTMSQKNMLGYLHHRYHSTMHKKIIV